ncbi:hypothetical protein [Comamonas sp. JC664]|uniref:hypothetical protein n=1 Tax=Comamonas sp. JC664 TaxID=2801917 RepID=UPI001989B2B3|nr:hypothetical protein [Comamonas sp. JC664]GHG79719.1 hypothetical protein GCM10012319_31860 [Comamonas sp. KCTC 72670]
MKEAVYAYVSNTRALLALARRVIARDWRQEWADLWRELTTTSADVVPVHLARRCAVLAAMETRILCADHVWLLGMEMPLGHPDAPALCSAGMEVGRLDLPTDEEPPAPSEGA